MPVLVGRQLNNRCTNSSDPYINFEELHAIKPVRLESEDYCIVIVSLGAVNVLTAGFKALGFEG